VDAEATRGELAGGYRCDARGVLVDRAFEVYPIVPDP
jgi:hypothetical protein